MAHVACLNDVLNNNGSSAVRVFIVVFDGLPLLIEDFVPTALTNRLEILIKEIRGHYCIDDKLTETLELSIVPKHTSAKIGVVGLHQ